ncbi:metallophosphoesterase [Humisphaera borealis]|uniref:Metallophosphoesterase n=1 Tax=Humisphaera borealis TaxID=2807512 RepID=A0A7M2WSL9_9BACT|nr:metallophosphoesterase [Humisphaera borealis]QOV88274.1 metallophosphoesterase [Humisphaera borealis]
MSYNAEAVIESLGCAAEENQREPHRVGQTIHLPPEGDLWIVGDVHDHRRNFAKFLAYADLANNPTRHIILHEIIHGDHWDAEGAEDSWHMLVRAAELKCEFPEQVHFLLANHDLAQIHGEGIMKAGVSVCEGFNKGIKRDFGDARYKVQVAITEFLLSQPLAIKTGNGIFVSHSLPPDDLIPTFDYTALDRELVANDYTRKVGPVYQLIWGRRATPAGVDAFLERVGAKLLITGHQPQDEGYALNGDRHVIIASDHNKGVFVTVELDVDYPDIHYVAQNIHRFLELEMPEVVSD